MKRPLPREHDSGVRRGQGSNMRIRNRLGGALTAAMWMGLAASRLGTGESLGQTVEETVYRITIARDLSESDALNYKLRLEGLGFLPINLDYRGDRVSVLYGNFPTHARAIVEKSRLAEEGFDPQEIVEIKRGGAAGQAAREAGLAPTFKVLVAKYYDAREAEGLKTRLQREGFTYVDAVANAGVVEVRAGQYADRNDALNLQALLRERGYEAASVIEVVGGLTRTATPQIEPQGRAPGEPPAAGEEPALRPPSVFPSPAITQSDIWRELSEDQKRKVIETVIMQERIAQGDEVIQKLIDLEKRLNGFDERMRSALDQLNAERQETLRRQREVEQLFRDANNMARGGQYQQAILKLREAVQLDPANQALQMRLRALEDRTRGDRYEGQTEETEKIVASLRTEAGAARNRGTVESLEEARSLWVQIRTLDPAKYEQEAANEINAINSEIRRLNDEEATVRQEAESRRAQVTYALIGSVGFLALLLSVVYVNSARRHRDMMKKIHEITQIRPMRELEGAAVAGHVAAAGGPAGLAGPEESGPFDPFGGVEAAQPGDPLAGAAGPPPARAAGRRPSPPPSPEIEDVFAQVAVPETGGGGEPPITESGGFDTADIFGDVRPTPAAGRAATAGAAKAEESTGGFEDIFADLPTVSEPKPAAADAFGVAEESTGGFALDDIFGDVAAGPAAPPPKPAAAAAPALEDSFSAITFGDIAEESTAAREPAMSAPQPAAAPPAPEDDPLSIFNELSLEPLAAQPKAAGEKASPATPSGAGGLETTRKTEESLDLPLLVEDDAELPPIKLAVPEEEPSAAELGGGTTAEAPTGPPPAAFAPRPASGHEATAVPDVLGEDGVVFLERFERAPLGEQPAPWKGTYPYATLTVENDDPPRGTSAYVSFRKREGEGKAYFSMQFPTVSGVISIEYDLRCNDKNKYLLGFFVEKDEDFQQSIHTKILRPEAQTTPQILLQGEKAPYLLGSWAHIKYVVNLNEGKVDGYIDATHIARGLHLPQAPKYLNTLSFRDHSQTVGDLAIANIAIRKIA